MPDYAADLHLVSRTVRAGTLPAGPASVVTLVRGYPQAPAEVWDAVTNPDRIGQWFLPISGDLRPGGAYQMEGNAGGEIRACEPSSRLQVTWIFGEPPSELDSSLVELRLEPAVDGGTQLTLDHAAALIPAQMWDRYGPGAVGVGWDTALLGLAMHLRGEDRGHPDELMTSPAMRAFMTGSSEAWGLAYAASGADPDAVARAVAGTTAAYVPPPEG